MKHKILTVLGFLLAMSLNAAESRGLATDDILQGVKQLSSDQMASITGDNIKITVKHTEFGGLRGDEEFDCASCFTGEVVIHSNDSKSVVVSSYIIGSCPYLEVIYVDTLLGTGLCQLRLIKGGPNTGLMIRDYVSHNVLLVH